MKDVTLYNGDCLEEMEKIEDESVDLVLSDLPYGKTKNIWDSLIRLDDLWKEFWRISKTSTAVVLFGQGVFSAKLILSQEKYFRYDLVWKKGERVSGFLNASRMPLRNHEDILVFYRKLPTYNPIMTEGIPLHSMGKSYVDGKQINNNYGKFRKGKKEDSRAGTTEKYPKSVLNFERPHPPIHPTQKPVDLCEWLITTYSNPRDVVLDATMGSGTTGVACKNLNRKFIGIELDKEYFKLAKERIKTT